MALPLPGRVCPGFAREAARQTRNRLPRAEFRVVLRSLASSLPLGFFAFAVGTVLLSALERMVLPLGRRGQARASLKGGFVHQVHKSEQ